MELAKFLNYPEIHAYWDMKTLPHLIQAIMNTSASLNLTRGMWLVLDDQLQQSSMQSGIRIPVIYHTWSDLERACMPCHNMIQNDGKCVLETPDGQNYVWQFNDLNDIDNIRYLLHGRYDIKSAAEYNGCYAIYDDVGFTGVVLSPGDWLIIPPDRPNSRLVSYTDTAFQYIYDQVGMTIILRQVSNRVVFGEIVQSIEENNPFVSVRYYPKFDATQCTNESFITAVTKRYPEMAFHCTNVLGSDRYCYAISYHGIPIGAISTGDWMLFYPESTPDNPKFKIVSNEEFCRDYRISH
ncbi:MAG: hypothetical protein NC548_05405 [Lachnospiraceae bacterium]|nr:hypothetical protein [Lachnospiraceae bacterium]